MTTHVEESLEDLLHQIDQKAEIVNHQIILLPPAGGLPGHASAEIFFSLWEYSKHHRNGLDYFAAGTLVVWDVDLLSDDLVRVHRAGEKRPTIYGRGQVAEAEPAVPGWTMPVDNLFPKRYTIDR